MSTQAQQPGALGLIAARWPRLTAGASAGGAGIRAIEIINEKITELIN